MAYKMNGFSGFKDSPAKQISKNFNMKGDNNPKFNTPGNKEYAKIKGTGGPRAGHTPRHATRTPISGNYNVRTNYSNSFIKASTLGKAKSVGKSLLGKAAKFLGGKAFSTLSMMTGTMGTADANPANKGKMTMKQEKDLVSRSRKMKKK